MSTVFNGKEFLESKAAPIELSNGFTTTVREVSDKQMEVLSALGAKTEPSNEDIRVVVATLLNTDVASIKEIGLVELRGVMDFLTGHLFG